MNKNFLNSFVAELNISSGGHWRGDCPACGGTNTFSVSNDFGNFIYHCYRSSCSASGRVRGEMSHADIEASLGLLDRGDIIGTIREFDLPEHFIYALSRPECVEYLTKNHCYEAVSDGRADVRYDPKQNRVVFLIKKDGVVYDAVGRALDRTSRPKWYRYGTSSLCFFVECAIRDVMGARGRPSTVVVVEDCASSCAVSSLCDSYALLGSQLGLVDPSSLVRYDTVIIALDKDASDKAIQMQRYLSFYCKDVKILLLENDLKYLSKKEIRNVITSICPIES